GDRPCLPRQGAVIPRLSCRRSGPAAAAADRQVSESSLFPPAKAIVTLGSVALALSLSGLAGVFRLARRDELLRGWRSPLLWPRRWRQSRGGGRARVELEGVEQPSAARAHQAHRAAHVVNAVGVDGRGAQLDRRGVRGLVDRAQERERDRAQGGLARAERGQAAELGASALGGE